MHARTTYTLRSLAQTITFGGLYAIFSFVKISPILGLPGQTITAAAMVAPIIGILIGAYSGTVATIFGGTIGFFSGLMAYPSVISGIVTASFAGMIRENRRTVCIFFYCSLLLLFAFYPSVGPFWLFPLSLWFQVVGLVILLTPFQSTTIQNLNSNRQSKLLYAFFLVSLTSTLAGQIAGSLAFEITSWPILIPEVGAWRMTWQVLAFLYPAERLIIAVSSALVGASLLRVLKSTNMKNSRALGLSE